MNLHILGTAGYHPTDERETLSAIIPELGFVLDAGTGFYRVKGKVQTNELHIFVSHLHLDHSVGLTYLNSILLEHRLKKIYIYGPGNIMDLHDLFDGSFFPAKLPESTELIVAKSSFSANGIQIKTLPLKHRGPAVGYRFSLPDFELAYITDTSVDDSYFPLINGADLVIHECNYPSGMKSVALEQGHTDAGSFLNMIQKTKPRNVLATHFASTDELLNKDTFEELLENPSVTIAEENMVIELDKEI